MTSIPTGQMPPEALQAFLNRFLSTVPRVLDAESLVAHSRVLFAADVVVLLRVEGDSEAVLAVAPQDEGGWARENGAALREWYRDAVRPSSIPGFSREFSLRLASRDFTDALVVYGEGRVGDHELIILGGATAPRYNSFHLTAASTLLRLHEQIGALARAVRAEQREADERRLNEMLSQALTEDVLPTERWDGFVTRIQANKGAAASTVLGPSGVIWTAYQVRARADDPLQAGTHSPDPPGAARDWMAKAESDLYEPYRTSIDFLLEGTTLDLPAICQAPLEARDDLHSGAVAVVLESAWRRVRDRALHPGPDPADQAHPTPREEATPISFLSTLIAATRDVIRGALTSVSSSLGRVSGDAHLLDRDGLRLYFANLLLSSAKLRHSYLHLEEDVEGHLSPRKGLDGDAVPAAVHRQYVLQLARFILGAVRILQSHGSIRPAPRAVSQAELLDSLLYLIDRYAHVELEVDERLRVREHLARGLLAEVELHLGKPFYRDHLLHVVDVFLLGHFLLRTHVRLIDGADRELLAHLVELERLHPPNGAPADAARLGPVCWLRDWAVAALLHDLGYQVMPTSSPQVAATRAAMYFALPGPAHPRWLSSERTRGQPTQLGDFVASLDGDLRKGGQGSWLPAPDTFEWGDHGALSAMRVAQVLVHAASSAHPGDDADWSLVNDYQRALHAITHHNLFAHSVRLETHPMACFLRLCDELQEWSRRRINIEQTVKRLYLEIAEAAGGIEGYESLTAIGLNVEVVRIDTKVSPGRRPVDRSGWCDGLQVTLVAPQAQPALNPATFLFRLSYKDSLVAHFDPTTTFLSKAYSLQNVDLSAMAGGSAVALEWRLELRFPRPAAYGSLSELDIYGLFTEQERELPRLRTFPSLEEAPPGVSALMPDGQVDRVAIVVSSQPRVGGDPGERASRLQSSPGSIVAPFVRFKQGMLHGRADRQ